MGITKSELFKKRQNRIASLATAFDHPARVAIIEYLMKVDDCICGDIVNELPLAQPTVSQHLKELKEAGLIKGDIEGKKICYCIDEAEWERAKTYMKQFMDSYVPGNGCC